MPISGYLDTIFGSGGDLATVPDAVQVDGTVSYTQGWGGDYELPVGNPSRLTIPRDQSNQLMYDVTSAIQQYQQKGTPLFITTVMNRGTPFSYSQGDQVISAGVRYTSLVDSNTTTPPGASWGTGVTVPLGGTGVASFTAYAPIFGGTTSTAALQSGTVGSAGQVLTSNGAGALATFQDNTIVVLEAMMPIGFVVSFTISTNPNSIYGFGTWTAITDKFLVAHGSTYTSTGGAATATLAANNIPTITGTLNSGAGTGVCVSSAANGASVSGGLLSSSGTSTNNTVTFTSTNTGGGSPTAFSIIPPYKAIYVWERTA